LLFVPASRVFFAAVFLILMVSVCAWAAPFRVGLEFGRPTGVLVIRPEPLDIKVGYDLDVGGGDEKFIHVSADYRVLSSYHLVDFLSMFISAGGYLQFFTSEEVEDELVLGGRIPVGLQVFFFDGVLEVFLEVAPTVSLFPSITAFDQWQGFLGFTVAIKPD
jgi:hypothetical protein